MADEGRWGEDAWVGWSLQEKIKGRVEESCNIWKWLPREIGKMKGIEKEENFGIYVLFISKVRSNKCQINRKDTDWVKVKLIFFK